MPIGSSRFEPNLRELSRDPRFVGMRLSERPRGDEFFSDEDWRHLRQLAELDQTLDVITQAFGEDRLIYGSNWPVSMHGGSYAAYKQIILDYYQPQGPAALEKLLCQNALKFYGLTLPRSQISRQSGKE